MGGSDTDDAITRVVFTTPSLTEPDARPAEPTLEAGVTLGRYVIRSVAGTGGMGHVYRAFDPELDREVALKVIARPRRDPLSTSAPAWLRREAQAMARLSHPNVVPVYDVETVGHRLFLVMELVEGRTLKDWLQEEKRPVAEILRVFDAAGRGLAAAHDAGIVHRDFKPANVLVGDDGAIRVTDFGIARTNEDGSDSIRTNSGLSLSSSSVAEAKTRVGTVMGTPAYMSPEQHEGGAVDARSDQYSFCVALYEALHGKRPFEATTVVEVAASKRAGPPRDAAPPGVPARVQRALRKGMAVEPELRFHDMEELLRELSPPSRRRGLGLAAVAVVGVGIAAATWAGSSDPDPCEGGSARLAEAWGEPQRRAIEAAMERSGVSFAEDGTSRILDALDQTGASWVDAWTKACRDTRDGAARDRTMRCLSHHHRQLGAMVTALSELDADSAAQGVQAVWSLPSPEQCFETTAGPDAPPDEIAQRVEAAREALQRSEALRRLGRQPEAREIAEAQLAIAKELGYAPLIAHAEFELGNIGIQDTELDAAALLESSYFRAMQAGDLDRAGNAASELVFEYGNRRVDLERAMDWQRHAKAAFETLGSPPDEIAELHNNTCTALLQDSRYPEAREECRLALGGYEQLHGREHPSLLAPLNNLAKIELDLRRYHEAAPYAERALAIARSSYGSGHPWTRNTLNLMGAVSGELGDLDKALEHFEEGLTITQQVAPHDVDSISLQLQNIAITYAVRGELDRAQAKLQEAIDLVAEELGPDHYSLGMLRASMGRVHVDQEDHAAAARELEAAIALMTPHFGDEHVEIALARFDLGGVRHAQGQIDEAKAIFAALSERDPSTIPMSRHVETLAWLAKIHVEQGQLEPVPELLQRIDAQDVPAGSAGFVAETRFIFAKAVEPTATRKLRELAIEQARTARRELSAVEVEEARAVEEEIDRWLEARG